MTNDNKTLADVQPGGRVRLGDQRSDLVPGIVRCAKCAFQLHRTNLYLQSGTVGAGDSKTEPCPNGCGPLWPVTWETWAREGWAEAERLHLENVALSAQPSPGGQGDARAIIEEFIQCATLGRPHGKLIAQAKDYLAARQPVGEPVEMSPEFTDTARAAIAWVLWHHQGGSSPVGQPLRFSLGMGQHDRMTDQQIAEAKRFAAWAGATTEGFHQHKPAQAVDLGNVIDQIAQQWDGCNYDTVGETIDVGQAIRAAGKRLIDSQAVGK